LVDAVLTVTAASDIFTQDVEEMVENGVIETETKKPSSPPTTTPSADLSDPDFPTPEEEQAALKAAGMVDQEPPKQGNGHLDLETFKRALMQMTDPSSVTKWFAGERKKIASEDMAVAIKLVNDRLLTLMRKEKAA
jgi:hypothetical protein